ncbi:MAG: endolytic transglycosylase MltG [Gammaproteobacteria bacterium]
MRKRFSKFLGLSILVISVAGGGLWLDYRNFLSTPLNLTDDTYVVQVPPGGNLGRLATQLATDGIIDSRRYLLWHAQLTGDAHSIKTGEYALNKTMTPVDLIDIIRQGKVIQYSFTVIEGWTFREMIDALKTHPQIHNTVLDQSAEEIMAALGLSGIHPEGRFLPDTYFFPANTHDIDFLGRAYRSMATLLEALWEDRDIGLAIKTPYEALIMASIVEKETGLASERNTIAGVFNRRLLKGMRLQTDPTVIYGMGERYDGNIRRRDLRTDTPYNTYRRHGLPPTPIALPSAAAIEATLHPEEGDELYFVSRGDGSHYFSSNLAEHNEAVIKYQLRGRRKNFSSHQN